MFQNNECYINLIDKSSFVSVFCQIAPTTIEKNKTIRGLCTVDELYRLPLFHKISFCNIHGRILNHYVILSRIYERNDGFEQHWEFVYVCD